MRIQSLWPKQHSQQYSARQVIAKTFTENSNMDIYLRNKCKEVVDQNHESYFPTKALLLLLKQ